MRLGVGVTGGRCHWDPNLKVTTIKMLGGVGKRTKGRKKNLGEVTGAAKKKKNAK